ncbi:Quinoprotein amine dehydrogenase, beta chain-like protein [Niveomyces insectorum RCEF 264]|uniref:Quinoprotein amine dehydrogenase, beta chain-like protein n=1 Tax=Niveomyces insectorum RCEF 264 TaxID=1081102 RepID=A0A167RFN3_9HYPO|nr:Quinoprotein amine dehydrogenase, beta chain-like protein [Niveomyces insectorum RCEF 264]
MQRCVAPAYGVIRETSARVPQLSSSTRTRLAPIAKTEKTDFVHPINRAPLDLLRIDVVTVRAVGVAKNLAASERGSRTVFPPSVSFIAPVFSRPFSAVVPDGGPCSFMPGPRKAKKDAKDAGGVVAAVTKHAAGKFTNGIAQGPASDTSSSSVHSPDFPPVATPSSNGNPTVSPMLEAVPNSSTANPSYAPSPRTIPGMSEWAARNGLPPGLAGSPGNLINLMGESPPSRWSSPRPYGTSHTSHTSQLSHASRASQPTSVSVSPPTTGDYAGMIGRRPLSYHMDPAAHYPSVMQTSPHEFSGDKRRSSLHSHYAHSRGTSAATTAAAAAAAAAAALPTNPPLPHQPQAHFYGAPDLDMGLQPAYTGMLPGQRGYHFSFDTLPSFNYLGGKSSSSQRVVTAGYEGGLEVYSVSKRGLDSLARLTGLRGGVYDAKILPWSASSSVLADAFPLIAVVIHGPVLPPSFHPDAGKDGGVGVQAGPGDGPDPVFTPETGAPYPQPHTQAEPRSDPHAPNRAPPSPASLIEYYQTSVEVYSLKLNRRMCTLLEAPRIALKVPITSPIFQPPAPSGTLHIQADAGNIVITSATTGECWVYRQLAFNDLPFVFVAKLWTTLQQPPKGSNTNDPALDGERARAASFANGSPPRYGPRQPVLSLSGRWLAYCPAAPSSQIALRGMVPTAVHGRAPGFTSLTPPHLPSVTADVDLPNGESVMNKIMRDATQEIISGAKWVGQQGWQAFNSYWKGTSGASTPQPPRSPPAGGYLGRSPDVGQQFPPTHGSASPAVVSKEPGIVSIVDVTTLGNSNAVHPVATFTPPLGCSFLSFSPTGLWLFTASTKGDVQTVWDLMRIQYTKASPLQGLGVPGLLSGSRVRQVAQFSRMTVARIVDVAWTKPNGERLAMVTERGTVHLLDLPSSAFTWPPPRRRGSRAQDLKAATSGSAGATETSVGNTASSAVSYASNALNTAFDAARPLLTRPRRSSANVPQSAGAAIVDHASHGGKMIAAGISHSLGRTGNAINQLRHSNENRVSLPGGSFAPGPSCVAWIAGKRHQSLFVLGDGLVRSFASRVRKKPSGQRTLHLSPNKDFRLNNLPDDSLAAAVRRYLEPEEYLDFTEYNDAGSNTLVLPNDRLRPTPGRRLVENNTTESSIPHAEIESSAPYQPFHTDRRIALYEVDSPPSRSSTAIEVAVVSPTAFAAHADPTGSSVLPATQPISTALDVDEGWPPSDQQRPKTTKKKAKAAAAAAAWRAKEVEQGDHAVYGHGDSSGEHHGGVTGVNSTDWAFGQAIATTLVNTGYPPMSEEESFNISFDETRALPPSAMERVLQQTVGENEQIVVTTRRRRGKKRTPNDPDEDGFFEDDCEVLDFADQRV